MLVRRLEGVSLLRTSGHALRYQGSRFLAAHHLNLRVGFKARVPCGTLTDWKRGSARKKQYY